MMAIRSAAQPTQNIWWPVFYFPSGFIVWVAARLGLSPNHLTFCAAVINFIGMIVVMTNPGSPPVLVAAYCIFFVAHTFDFADGQMATALGLRSKRGAWLDSSFDICKSAFISVSLFKIVQTVEMPAIVGDVVYFAIFGSLVNYSVSLAAMSYRSRADVGDVGDDRLGRSLSVYGLRGSLSRFVVSGVREHGNFLLIILLFAFFPKVAVGILIAWGIIQWALAVNRIRHIAGLLQAG
jgi:phosphatidylglycerophosphate synthase